MKISNILPSTCVLFLASSSIASPVPTNRESTNNITPIDLLSVAHRAIDEVECARDCLYDRVNALSPCQDQHCRESCSAFTAAYWGRLSSCIHSSCTTQTSVGKAYVDNMRNAVNAQCDLLIPGYFAAFGTDEPTDPKPPVNPKPPVVDPKPPVVVKGGKGGYGGYGGY
ncbi:hypothetical protein TWF694_003606 [Orbilia ellipsospora]|uniref:Extracellular membrane protein CFEM domain-containing protein n=1 Tax=Orbilia ellipsospora TaxID=2528407 RepID=A0AAV9X012_9PEZI